MNGLQPLFDSPDFPDFLTSVNSIISSDNTKSIRDSLKDWFQVDSGGTSKIDRLLPFLASLIENPSFQAVLPVVGHVLEKGKGVWADLLPGLADVVYTDLNPDNLENAFELFSLSSDKGEHDYATSIKTFARFLKTDVDGKTASMRLLELADEIRDQEVAGTSHYEFLHHIQAEGAIEEYFINQGAVRGEVVDPKLSESPDDANSACPNLNDSPEHRQICAYLRMFQRQGAKDAPITQLAGLVREFELDHPDFIVSVANWFAANRVRVSRGLSDFVARAQVVSNIDRLNIGSYLSQFAQKSGLDLNAPISGPNLADLLQKSFSSPDFTSWLGGSLPAVNSKAFGDKNAALFNMSNLVSSIAALYQSPDMLSLAPVLIPGDQTLTLSKAIQRFSSRHHSVTFQVTFHGSKQPVDLHLGDIWVAEAKADLGEDVGVNYVLTLLVSQLNQVGQDFENRKQPLAEWYFNAPYSNPETIEFVLGYAINDLNLLGKYYENRDWLENDFANEVYGAHEDDKRAFRLLVEQVPNIILYVRSGMARSGADLTHAMALDTNGYLVNTYVKLIAKVTESGWLSKAVRLLEVYHSTQGYQETLSPPLSDNIGDKDKYTQGVKAIDSIARSLVKPSHDEDYSTTILSRLMQPLSSIVSEPRRAETETFLLTSADQLLGLSDKSINDFLHDLYAAKPPGEIDTRRESYKAVSDFMKNKNCPDLLIHLSNLFQENAVQPALNFFAKKIDDGSLPKALLFVRRILGFGN